MVELATSDALGIAGILMIVGAVLGFGVFYFWTGRKHVRIVKKAREEGEKLGREKARIEADEAKLLGEDKDPPKARLTFPLRAMPPFVMLVGALMGFLIYLVAIVFGVIFGPGIIVMGGFIGMFIVLLPFLVQIRLTRLKKGSEEGFVYRGVPPNMAVVSYLAFKKVPHVALYIFDRNGKLKIAIGPHKHPYVLLQGKPYRIPRPDDMDGHIEFTAPEGVRAFMYWEGVSEPMKVPGYNQRLQLEVQNAIAQLTAQMRVMEGHGTGTAAPG